MAHIVLQVEETDEFMINIGYNPGYKIIIQTYGRKIGAAGGYKFNPYYGENVQKVSQKIDCNESDVLGFYLDNIDDIYELPLELNTKEFWNVLISSKEKEAALNFRDSLMDDYGIDESNANYYYKILHSSEMQFQTISEEISFFQDTLSKLNTEDDWVKDLNSYFEREKKIFQKSDDTILEKDINFAIINKQTLELVENKWSTNRKGLIADYLWCPCPVLPGDLWEELKGKNEELRFRRIFDLNESLINQG